MWTVDLKARKIRVNVLSPGTIDTGIFDGLPAGAIDRSGERPTSRPYCTVIVPVMPRRKCTEQ